MLAFVDESGDPGSNLAKGSSELFVVCMVVFETGEDASITSKAIVDFKQRSRHKPELRFVKCRNEIRTGFMSVIRTCPFTACAVVVEKNQTVRVSGDQRLRDAVKLLTQSWPTELTKLRLVIDGKSSKALRNELAAQLRQVTAQGSIASVGFKNSKNDPLLWLADMTAGAIARATVSESPDSQWLDVLRPRVHTIHKVSG